MPCCGFGFRVTGSEAKKSFRIRKPINPKSEPVSGAFRVQGSESKKGFRIRSGPLSKTTSELPQMIYILVYLLTFRFYVVLGLCMDYGVACSLLSTIHQSSGIKWIPILSIASSPNKENIASLPKRSFQPKLNILFQKEKHVYYIKCLKLTQCEVWRELATKMKKHKI